MNQAPQKKLLSVEKNGTGFESAAFRSVCECVSVSFYAHAKGGSVVCCSVVGFTESGEEQTVLKKIKTIEEDGELRYEFQFDPVSLAVYQKLVCFRLRLISDALISVEECAYVENEQLASLWSEAEERLKKKRTERAPRSLGSVLFVGNSLLLGMENRYGMCSSSPKNDYYYHVTQAILQKYPDCQFYRVHGAPIEHAESLEEFHDALFTRPNGYTGRPFVESLTEELDLVILQITDNVNTEKKTATFLTSAELLLQEIKKRCPHAQIVWVYGWYFKKPLFPRLWELFDAYDVEPVNLLPLRMRMHEAAEGMRYESLDGTQKTAPETWLTHPGDKGMYAIAQKIIKTLEEINIL